MADSPQLPDRIQRELEEALRQGGVDKLSSRKRPKSRSFRLGFPDPRPRNPGELVLYGVGIFVAAYLLPVSFKVQLFVLAALCVAVAVISHFVQPHGNVRKYWRGRYLDIPSGRWQERVYRIIYRGTSR